MSAPRRVARRIRAAAHQVVAGPMASSIRRAVRPLSTVVRSSLIVIAVRLARWVPLSLGYASADLAGRVRTSLPAGRREVRRMRSAFPDRDDHVRLVRSRAALPFRNHVSAARLLRPGVPDDLRRHRRVCPPETTELLESEQSLVVAASHLALELYLPFADRAVLDRDLWFVVGTGIEADQRPCEQRAHRRAVDAYNRAIADRGARLIEIGDAGTTRAAIRALRQPGAAVVVLVDAEADPDDPGVVVRSFAGRREAAFATGAAQLARLAGVPLLVCDAERRGSDVVFAWSSPVAPAGDRDGDASVTAHLLDLIESAVGRHPADYALPIGGSRRWDGSGWVEHDGDDIARA